VSGHCVDGVCCDTACDGVCVACSAAAKGDGADGACGPLATGTRDVACEAQPASTCGTTGTCDRGACAKFADGTTCGPAGAACHSGQCIAGPPQFRCEGDVEVLPPDGRKECAPYRCDPTSGQCLVAPCGTSADCVDGSQCVAGACVAFVAVATPAPNAGCAVSAVGDRSSFAAWLAVGALALRRARRRDQGSA
jgi:MYXO-CTERM domain-containing protein